MLNESSLENLIKELHQIRQSSHLIRESFSPNILPAIEVIYRKVKKMRKLEFSSFIKELESRAADYPKIKKDIENLININHAQNIRLSREETFIACMSKDVKSTLMWAHYADYHKGFVLEYDTDEIANLTGKCIECKDKCAMQHTLGLYPVVYSKNRFNATEYEMETLKLRINNYYYGFKDQFCIPDMLFYIKTNSFKGDNWKYEKEWRLVYSCSINHPTIKFDVLKPKAIYLGSQMSLSNKKIIKKLIEGKNLVVYEMYIDNSKEKYALSYRLCN